MDRRHLLSVAVCLLVLACHTIAERSTLASKEAPTAPPQDAAVTRDYPPGTSPPKIVKQSEELYVVVPKVPTEIECEATGNPEPTYRWQVQVVDDFVDVVLEDPFSMSGGNLAVRRPTDSTNGVYRCLAINQFGVAISNKIKFVIAFTDGFIETEKMTYTFDEGDLASIPCNQQDSMPLPSIFWTDDADPGTKIGLDRRVSIDPNFNLRFSNIELGDTGNYQCNVKNDKLRIQILSPVKELVVRKVENINTRPATLVYQPESSVVAFRTRILRLKCIAEGYPTPEITWEKEDEDLPADRVTYESYGQELVISGIKEEDAATYKCTASNDVGVATTSTTRVTVQSDPYWVNKPEDINIVIGGSGELVCEAGGIPVPMVSWLVNGKPSASLSDNPRVTITEGQGGGRVEYADAMTEDGAVYLCVAQNIHSEIMFSGFVNVESIPADLTNAPALTVVTIEGKSFELICAGQGSPKPDVEWYFKNRKLVTDDSKVDIVESGNSARTTSTLTVKGVTVEDSGNYVCSVSNGFGANNGTSRVTVRKATTVTVGPEDSIYVKKEEVAVVTCEVDHDEALPVTVTWSRDVGSGSEELNLSEPGGRFRHAKTGTNNLKVLETVVGDTGTYECKAVTDEDESSASAELIVQTVPAPPSGLVVAQRADDSDLMASLAWMSGDDGHAAITEYMVSYETVWEDLGWIEEDTVSASSTQLSLDLSPWVTYRFRVVAVNSIGSSEPSQSSDPYVTAAAAVTEAPQDVGIMATDPGVMEVTWPEVHPIAQNGPGFKYVVRWREQDSDEWTEEEITNYKTTSYEIDTGDIYKELQVEVIYKNDLGPGPASDRQSGFTGEGTPKVAPQNVVVLAEGAKTVNITWDSVPDASVNGHLKSFKVYFEMMDAQAQGQSPAKCLPDTLCRVEGLTPFQTYQFQVAVKNGQREGPKSDPVILKMPEGQSDEVFTLTMTTLSDRILVKWSEPASPNGVITEYYLSYNTYDGDDLGETTSVTVPDPQTNNYTISPAVPNTDYRVEVYAINGAGKGKARSEEDKTREGGVPPKPILVDSQITPDKEYINVTFVQSDEGAAANQFYVQYKEANDDEADFQQTKPMDVLDGDLIMVTGLSSKTEYTLKIVAVNDDGETAGATQMVKTLGAGDTQVANPIYIQGWFIILLIIIVALLCILLVLCILKSQRGGKYNVSDKEQQRKGDIESTPLKDEGGFEEFEPRKDNPDGELPRGSQGSLKDSEPGSSDTDSLKEYADGELGKFNEEGSFIGQYGDKKQRPTEEGEQGGAAYSTFV